MRTSAARAPAAVVQHGSTVCARRAWSVEELTFNACTSPRRVNWPEGVALSSPHALLHCRWSAALLSGPS